MDTLSYDMIDRAEQLLKSGQEGDREKGVKRLLTYYVESLKTKREYRRIQILTIFAEAGRRGEVDFDWKYCGFIAIALVLKHRSKHGLYGDHILPFHDLLNRSCNTLPWERDTLITMLKQYFAEQTAEKVKATACADDDGEKEDDEDKDDGEVDEHKDEDEEGKAEEELEDDPVRPKFNIYQFPEDRDYGKPKAGANNEKSSREESEEGNAEVTESAKDSADGPGGSTELALPARLKVVLVTKKAHTTISN